MQPTVLNAFSIAADRHANGRALPRKVRNALGLVAPGDTLPFGCEIFGYLGDDALGAAAYLSMCDDRRAELEAEILRFVTPKRDEAGRIFLPPAPDEDERQRIGARLRSQIGRPSQEIVEAFALPQEIVKALGLPQEIVKALTLPEGAEWSRVLDALVKRWNTPVTVPGAPRLRRAHAEF